MKVTIKKIGINGEGIGYYYKKPIFIDGVIPEEEVEFKIEKETDTYILGSKVKILKESKHRIKPLCLNCDSCNLSFVDYDKQIELKNELFLQCLNKYTKIKPDVLKGYVKSEMITNYRNSLKLPLKTINGKLVAGIYQKNSNKFVEIKKCVAHEEGLENIKLKILNVLNNFQIKSYDKVKNGVRYLIIRGFNNKYNVHIIFNEKYHNEKMVEELKKIKEINGLFFSFNNHKNPLANPTDIIKIFGNDKLSLTMNNYNFMVSNESFVQLNLNQAKNIFNYIKSLIKPCDVLVEEYSGIGFMSILFNDMAKKIYAGEVNKYAVKDFKENILLNNINNISVRAEEAYKHLKSIKEKIDYLIVDPSRDGLEDKMIKEIMDKDISNIVYMSCGMSSMSKDLAILSKKYHVKSIKLFDIFAQTPHVECVALLKRK